MVHYNKQSIKNSILNTFIGKNSPNLVKKEVQSWLSYMDENQSIVNDTDKKESVVEHDIVTQNINHKVEVQHDKTSLGGIKPRKKQSFTSLIFQESFVESESKK